MATEGTSYGDVNYSVPEGADPLGIGVPDLGKSSYDPIATIRHGWENSRQERLMNKEMGQQNYQSYLKNMPTPEGVNQKITRNLNKDIGKMGGLFKRKQQAGGFAGFAKGDSGESLTAELSQLENKVASEVPVYNHYSEVYEKDVGVMRNPNNKDKIDWDLTNENVDAMNKAENVTDFAQPFADNGGSLVVMRPEEADMIGWVKDSVDTFAPGLDSNIIAAGKDPNTGKYKTTTLETKDQKRVYDSIIKGYANAPRAVKNEVDRMYADAPAETKTDENGVEMEADAWYATQFAPEWGRKTKTTQTTIDDDDTQPTGLGSGIPRINGEIDTNAMMEPIIMASVTTTPAQYKDKVFGKGKKKVADESTTSEEMEFESYNMPLTGIEEVFDSMTPADAIDTSTGSEPDRTKIGSHKAASTSYMPTYNGESDIPVEIEVTDGQGNKSMKKYTVKPGKPIPMNVQRELIKQGVPMSYEPYLLTKSVYGASQEEKSMGAIQWSDYVSKHGKTVITPWASINNAFLTKMGAEEYQVQELHKNMLEMYNKLNQTP